MSLSTVEAKASEIPAEDPAVKGITLAVVDALYAVLDPRLRVS